MAIGFFFKKRKRKKRICSVDYSLRAASPHNSVSPRRGQRSRSLSRSRRSRSRSRSRSPDAANPGNNLYVTGLSTRVTNADLEKFFGGEGKVTECHLVTDPRTRESCGFAFVTMETVEGADRCIKYLNRSVLEGRLITVEKVLFTNIFVLQCSVVRVTDLEFSLKVPLQKCCLINFGSRSCMCNFIEFSVRSKQLNLPHHDMCSASTFETHRFKFDCFAGGCKEESWQNTNSWPLSWLEREAARKWS
ncbi:uncharacterized protein LOC102622263 isoform X1 [Citrus sinensis]|uniref:uncharacterized protein LOC102622263 isoform X1 n=1 Tax=Citrus sinensis TaxID=2711 RepID=UPI0022778BC6|nr:uncharacterized protein LOC102622263 isoform X1 [Citrus sinensis]